MFNKSVFAAAAAAPFMATAAFAGPYVNVEANSGFVGSDYAGTVTDIAVGYEGALGENAGWYAQAGPAIVAIDGAETDTQFSGKAGLGVDVTENVNVYGEFSFLTADGDNNYGAKAGVKYTF